MGTEIVFQLTRRELDALLALEASPAAPPACDPRTVQSLVNKGLVTREGGVRLKKKKKAMQNAYADRSPPPLFLLPGTSLKMSQSIVVNKVIGGP